MTPEFYSGYLLALSGVLERSGHAGALPETGAGPVTVERFLEICLGAVAATGDQRLGLRVGRAVNLGAIGLLGHAILASRTIRQAAEILIKHNPFQEPGTEIRLRYADGRAVIDAGVPVALATDYNPTSSISSMLFVMFLACLYMKLAPSEALAAATINAAHAIGQADQVGSLEPGKQADLLVLDVPSHRDIAFYVGRDIVDRVLRGGRVVAGRG